MKQIVIIKFGNGSYFVTTNYVWLGILYGSEHRLSYTGTSALAVQQPARVVLGDMFSPHLMCPH